MSTKARKHKARMRALRRLTRMSQDMGFYKITKDSYKEIPWKQGQPTEERKYIS